MTQSILVGYELGTGVPVHLEPKHLMIVGLTGDAGKTTAVLGIASRWSDQKFVVFKTKIGEDVFKGLRTIPPYFREQKATWQSIEALIQASLGEKINIIRTTLMKVCQGVNTIQDVMDKVNEKIAEYDGKGKGGFEYDMLYQVREYLRQVITEMGRYKFADKLDLQPGVNVVDLSEMATSDNAAVMMSMVIGATADNILKHHRNTSLVVPEAWQVIPGDRKTPAQAPVEALIRLGRVQHNYVIIDSQDIAGVNTKIRGQVGNYLIGRLGGMNENEIKRAKQALPPEIRRQADELTMLPKGHFYAVLGGRVTKLYARPAGLDEQTAIGVAKGEITMEEVQKFLTGKLDGFMDKTETPQSTPAAEIRSQDDDVVDELQEKQIIGLQNQLSAAETEIRRLKHNLEQSERALKAAEDKATAEEDRANENSEKAQKYDELAGSLAALVLPTLGKGPVHILQNDGILENIAVNTEMAQVTVTERLASKTLDDTTLEGQLLIMLTQGKFATGPTLDEIHEEYDRLWGCGSSEKPGKSNAYRFKGKLKAALEALSVRPYSFLAHTEKDTWVEVADAMKRLTRKTIPITA